MTNLGRKDRTVENMVSMVVSRELPKENAMANANTNNTAIHAIKSINKNTNITSSKKPKNKCSKCGRLHDFGNAQPKIKHALYAINQGTLQIAAGIKRQDNFLTSHLVFQEQINLQPNHLNKS